MMSLPDAVSIGHAGRISMGSTGCGILLSDWDTMLVEEWIECF